VIVEGYAKGPSYLVGQDKDINHAWNGVKIDGTWYLLDATWGAGAIENDQFVAKFNPYYFATPPDQLIYSHFPAESQWQLLPTVYTRAAFDQFPDISAHFFRDRLQLLSHKDNRTISANRQSEIRLNIPDNILIAAQLLDKSGSKLDQNYTFVQKQGQQAIIRASFPSVGEYELIIFSKNTQEEIYHQAVKYDIQSVAAGKTFPLTYASFHDKNVYLEMPLTQSLPINQASYFQLKVNEASKVIVVNKDTNNMTELTPSSSFFVGSVVINPGKTVVAAQFPGSDQYWTLLEYN
jgi:transglutaminase/protease-like cytokinesis protein 3